ncbi:MAG: phosphoribosylaminoimidazolesuccinocarboxamide synthase [Flavobacteriales bacterium]|nr:phosphoribosylaminoimidazolesuccinocarboxamide synthase [Flavobacteriales bacterium]
MNNTLTESSFNFLKQKSVYKGKVRDVYNINDELLVMVVSDRISAFDSILPKGIPYKGQVLNQVAKKSMELTKDVVPNWIINVPDPIVTIGRLCNPYPIEMVIRGYLSGHSWREYSSGKRILCGVEMPDGMKENDRFPEPIITPATKAEEGHDEDISREDIIAQGIVSEAEYIQLETYTRNLFAKGTEISAEKGLILVDTKYEFGNAGGEVLLIDEIHTPDSSRYFYQDGYQERQDSGEKQKQLSKEFVREWLIENGFQGLEGQSMPPMPDEFVTETSDRYIELYEKISGDSFNRGDLSNIGERVEKNVNAFLESYYSETTFL